VSGKFLLQKSLPSPQTTRHNLRRVATPKTIGSDEIHAAIERLATAISARHPASEKLILLGIANGGIELAKRLAEKLSNVPPLSASKGSSASAPRPSPSSHFSTSPLVRTAHVGTLDISFHRDDIGRHPIPKEFAPTHIPVDVHGANVILVDDVLFSGRTVKAALDELFDHGRPAKVELAILVDRGGRLLPFAADYCGFTLAPKPSEKVVVVLDSARPASDLIRVDPAAAATHPPFRSAPTLRRKRKT
jgi:pyrimidine operon attenuation protein/uracil phosphoribosyltransferase